MLLVASSTLLGVYVSEAQLPQKLGGEQLDFWRAEWGVVAVV